MINNATISFQVRQQQYSFKKPNVVEPFAPAQYVEMNVIHFDGKRHSIVKYTIKNLPFLMILQIIDMSMSPI
jgi:hypothetical protein